MCVHLPYCIIVLLSFSVFGQETPQMKAQLNYNFKHIYRYGIMSTLLRYVQGRFRPNAFNFFYTLIPLCIIEHKHFLLMLTLSHQNLSAVSTVHPVISEHITLSFVIGHLLLLLLPVPQSAVHGALVTFHAPAMLCYFISSEMDKPLKITFYVNKTLEEERKARKK